MHEIAKAGGNLALLALTREDLGTALVVRHFLASGLDRLRFEFKFVFFTTAADTSIVLVGVVLSLGLLVEDVNKVERGITAVVDDALLPSVVDVDEHLQVAQDGQLHCLLQQTFFSFAVSHLINGYIEGDYLPCGD